MTSRQRLLAAYRREEVDRLPVYLWGFWPVLDEEGEVQFPMPRSGGLFSALVEYIGEHSDLVAPWYPYTPFEYYCFGRAFDGARVVERQLDNGHTLQEVVVETPHGPLVEQILILSPGRRGVVKRYITTDEELQRLLCLPYDPPAINFDLFFAFWDRLGDRGIVRPYFGDAAGLVWQLLGSEKLAYWSLDRRSAVRELLDLFQDRLLAVIRQCGEAGIQVPVIMSGQWVCLPPLHSPRDFHEFVVEYDQQAIDLFHSYGMQVVVSCHTSQPLRVLDHFVEMGPDVLLAPIYRPWSDITPQDLRQRVSPYMAVEGGIAVSDFHTRDRAGLIERCRHALEASHDGRGLILSTDESPVGWGRSLTPELADKIRTFLDFAHRTRFTPTGW